jgi:hypothetical protein
MKTNGLDAKAIDANYPMLTKLLNNDPEAIQLLDTMKKSATIIVGLV